MAFVYVANQRWPDLERAVGQMAEELKEVREPFFSVVSFLRLANRGSEVQRLADAAIRLQDSREFMSWAGDDIFGWALFQPYREFVRAGGTDEAFDRLWQKCLELGGRDTQKAREHHRKFGLHLAGRADRRWTRQELLSTKKRSGSKVSLLLTDYEHWLGTARQVPWIVADEFRLILGEALDGMTDDVTGFLHGLKRTVFEPHLARKLDFLSLDRFSRRRPAFWRCTISTISWPRPSWSTRRFASRRSRSAWTSGTRSRTCSSSSGMIGGSCQFLEQYATWTGS